MLLYIQQKVFTMRDRFSVRDEHEQDIYTVWGEFLSWKRELYIDDLKQREVARVWQTARLPTAHYAVRIGGIDAFRIVRQFTLFRSRYVLEGLDWQVQGDFTSHNYTITDGSREIMHLSKHWISWGDSYQLDIHDESDALACLCVALAIEREEY